MKIVVAEFIDEAALKAFGAAFCVVNDPTLVDAAPMLRALGHATTLSDARSGQGLRLCRL
ncbi:MAG: hypothetical protein H2045_02025 [Rhizobiales bacterium]|nr:hypothetical protein [Hyphomicrobiales bacterium]